MHISARPQNSTLQKPNREFLVQHRFLGGKAEAKLRDIMRPFESRSYDCSLNDLVEDFNITMSSVVPLQGNKKSTDRISPAVLISQRESVGQQNENTSSTSVRGGNSHTVCKGTNILESSR